MQVTRKRLPPGEMPAEPGLYEFFPYTQTVFFDGVNYLPIAVPPSALPDALSPASAAVPPRQMPLASPGVALQPGPLPQPKQQPSPRLASTQLPRQLLLQLYAQQRTLPLNQPSQQQQLQQLQQQHISVPFSIQPPSLPKPRQVVPSPLAPGTSSFALSLAGSAPPFIPKTAFALEASGNFANSVPNSPGPRSVAWSSTVPVAYTPKSDHYWDHSDDEDEAVDEVEVNLFEYPKKTPVVIRKPGGAIVAAAPASPSRPSPGISTPWSNVVPGVDRKPNGTSRGGGAERTMAKKLSALAPEFVSKSGCSPKTPEDAPASVSTEPTLAPDLPASGREEYQNVPENTLSLTWETPQDVKMKKFPAEGAEIQNSPLKFKLSLPSSAQAAALKAGETQKGAPYRTSSSTPQKPTVGAQGKSKKQQSPVPSVRRQTAPIPAVDGWGKTMSNGWTCRPTSALSADDGGWGTPPLAPSWEIDPWNPRKTASKSTETTDVWDATPAPKPSAAAPGEETAANPAAGVEVEKDTNPDTGVAAEHGDSVADEGDHASHTELTQSIERGKGITEEGMHVMKCANRDAVATELSESQMESLRISNESVGETRTASPTEDSDMPPTPILDAPVKGTIAGDTMPALTAAASTEHADIPPPPKLDTLVGGTTLAAAPKDMGPDHLTFRPKLDDKGDDRRWSMATLRDENSETEQFAGEKHHATLGSVLPSNTSCTARLREKQASPCRGESREGKALLRLKFKLPEGKLVYLAYHENDQPEEVAQRFCRMWCIPTTFVPSITKLLLAEIDKAEAHRASEL